MKKTLTAAQMREADRRCIEDLGIPGAVLMNNAGSAVFREIDHGPIGIVCGKGNNGGDGYVVARLALLAGMDTRVVLLADPGEITGHAKTFLDAYLKLGGPLRVALSPEDVAKTIGELSDCAVLVDAMLGTGTKGEVREPFRSAITTWPQVNTIAVDLPSGLNADTGEPCGCCIRADTTVTFQFAKAGFESPAAVPYLGRLVIADIGIPEVCADDAAWARLRGQQMQRQ
ncbi:MAG: NAD(P)H-hydrate epimerase [Candidatus Hydrogenedentes bacterium]|nr:NAD(P)H-hydrate epimerase [Candidatus Hydrogenedentota bacterium]